MKQTQPVHQTAVRTQARMSALQRRAHDVLEELDRQRDYDARLAADERLLSRARMSDYVQRGDTARIWQSYVDASDPNDRAALSALGEPPRHNPPSTESSSHETPSAGAPTVNYSRGAA